MGAVCAIPKFMENAETLDCPLRADEARGQAGGEEFIDEENFTKASIVLIKLAADGFPKVLHSTIAKRNDILRRHDGDAEAAVLELNGKGSSLSSEFKDIVLNLIPYVGLPIALASPMWRNLRRCCLFAAVFGHDLQDDMVLGRVAMVTFFCEANAKAMENGIEIAVRLAWLAFCSKLGYGRIVAKLPVSKVPSCLPDFEAMGKQRMLDAFKEGPTVPRSEWEKELELVATDPEWKSAPNKAGKKTLDDFLSQSQKSLKEVKLTVGF